MQQGKDPVGREGAWFVYERQMGKLRAKPANAKGWFATITCVIGLTAAAIGVFFILFPYSPLLAGLTMGVVIILGVIGTIWLAVAKGRQVH